MRAFTRFFMILILGLLPFQAFSMVCESTNGWSVHFARTSSGFFDQFDIEILNDKSEILASFIAQSVVDEMEPNRTTFIVERIHYDLLGIKRIFHFVDQSGLHKSNRNYIEIKIETGNYLLLCRKNLRFGIEHRLN